MQDEVDWSRVSPEMAQQIAAQGEKYLLAQMQMAVAADQRAMTLSGVMSTVATALLAAAITYGDKSERAPVLVAGLAVGVLMLVAAAMCAWSARQVDWFYPGNEPANWYGSRFETLAVAVGGEAENYQHHIQENARVLKRNGQLLGCGVVVALLAPLVGLAVWWGAVSLSSPASKATASGSPLLSSSGATSHASRSRIDR